MALGDGAGSATSGGLGADLATRAALRAMAAHCADKQARAGLVEERTVTPAGGSRPTNPQPQPELTGTCRPGALTGRGSGQLPAAEAAIRRAFGEARTALEREAAGRGGALRDLATTLLVCLATPEWIAAGQIGDGAVVLGEGDGAWRTLTKPASGEYLNETVFVTSDDALDRAQIATHKGPVRELAVFSDGLQMLALKLADTAPHAPFFRPLFNWLSKANDPFAAGRDLHVLLHSPRVTDRTDDDLSLCLARWDG